MQKHISKMQFFAVSLMLFSMFFGAGNFIFPPMLGKEAGTNVYEATMFFCLTGVILPILGIAAISLSKSMDELVNRAGVVFGMTFTILIYITIGPAFAIPRATNMPFEVSLAPFIDPNNKFLWLCFYSFIYFGINYIICVNKSTMIDTLGKYLTPIMLILLVLLFLAGVINPIGDFNAPTGEYATHPVSKGFLEGYQTMDALASLIFATVIINSMRSLGVKNEKAIFSLTIKSGILAGAILACVYMMLGFLGASSSTKFMEATNGAALLSNITDYLFGNFGRIVLGAIFLLACLTTTVGLISSASDFFSKFTPKIKYSAWCIIWSFLSFCVATIGLDSIIKYSIPVLYIIYPITIMYIILSLINGIIQSSSLIYRSCIYLAAFLGIINSLDTTCDIQIKYITYIISRLPFYEQNLGWIVPEAVCFIITYAIFLIRKKNIEV